MVCKIFFHLINILKVSRHFSTVEEAAEGDLKATASCFSEDDSFPSSSSTTIDSLEQKIRSHLRYIMQSVDLDNVTSKDIRKRLLDCLKIDSLAEYKEFIDREMLVILGQMDKPTKIFDYLYLGTEWNASNWNELKANRFYTFYNLHKKNFI